MVIVAAAVIAVVIAVVIVEVIVVAVIVVVVVVVAATVTVVVSLAVIFCEEFCPLCNVFRTVSRHVQMPISLTCNSCFKQAFFFLSVEVRDHEVIGTWNKNFFK